MRRVAITGIGLVSALGASREEVWRNLVEGKSGIGEVTLFSAVGYRSALAAELTNYQPERHFSSHEQRRRSRCDQIAILAAGEALDDSGLQGQPIDTGRIGVVLGAGTGDLFRNEDYLADLRTKGVDRARPSEILNYFSIRSVRASSVRRGSLFVEHHCARVRGRRHPRRDDRRGARGRRRRAVSPDVQRLQRAAAHRY
jgi:3-oxoacyl-(acyl-carrier-protein) synthase